MARALDELPRVIVAAVHIGRERLRADRGATAMLVLLVAVTAALAAAVPLWVERTTDGALRDTLASAPSSQRNIEFSRDARIEPLPDTLAAFATEGARLEAELPASLRSLVTGRASTADTVEFLASGAPVPITQFRLRVQSDVGPHIRLISGRAPTPSTQTLIVPGRFGPSGQPLRATVYEAALSRQTSDLLGLPVGTRSLLEPATNKQGAMAIDVVGIFDIIDPTDSFWFDDRLLLEPGRQRISAELTIYHAGALIDADAYPALFHGDPTQIVLQYPFRYHWRYLLEPSLLHPDALRTVTADLAKLRAAHPFRASTVGSPIATVSTGLPTLVQSYDEQRRTTEVALGVAATGPTFAAVGALALLTLALARRRRDALLLIRSRGGTTRELVGAQLLETVVVTVPIAAIGAVLALALLESPGISGTTITTSALAAAGVVVLAAMLAVGVTVRTSGGQGQVGREPVARPGTSVRRLVLDVLVVALAVAGWTSLRGRGAVSASGVPSGSDVTVFLTTVPVLLIMAGALVALRLRSLPIRFLAVVASRRRGFVALHAMRHAARTSGSTELPLLTLVLTIAIASFSVVVATSIERGQDADAWQQVGADIRLDVAGDFALPAALDVASLPGVTAMAEAARTPGDVTGGSLRREVVTVEALDIPAYGVLTAGTPADAGFPASFLSAPTPDLGSTAQPIPALISADLASRGALSLGAVITVGGGGGGKAFRVDAIRQRFGGFGALDAFVVVPMAAVRAAVSTRPPVPTIAFLRVATGSETALAAEVAHRAGDQVTVTSRVAAFDALRSVPLVGAVSVGFLLAVLVGLLYAAVAVFTAAFSQLSLRARELGLLRAIGAGRGQAAGSLLVEQALLLLVALVSGVAVGVVAAGLTLPDLGLDRFVRPGTTVVVAIDWLSVVAVAAVPVLVAILAAVPAWWAVRRSDVAHATRSVDR